MSHARARIAVALTVLALPASATATIPHTYVSGSGDDVNPCDITTPCRTFLGALSRTDPGGTISAIGSPPGASGAMTISQSVTIDGGGFLASVVAGAGNGITINGAGIVVTLKDVSIDNAAVCAAGSADGIHFQATSSALNLDNVTIQGFPGAGVDVVPGDGHGTISVKDSLIVGNCTAGVLARQAGGDMTVQLQNDFIAGNPTGVLAGAGSTVTLTNDTIVANAAETTTEPGGTLMSSGDNRIGGVTGTSGSAPATPTPPGNTGGNTGGTGGSGGTSDGGTGGSTGSGGSAGGGSTATPTPHCVVPKLSGLTVTAAAKALRTKHCALGKVRYVPKRHRPRGHIYAQSLKRGTTRKAGTKVGVTVAASPPKHHGSARSVGASTRAWVSPTGDDGAACTLTAPCRTFTVARDHVRQNGTIGVLGNADYGALTIDHSLIVDGLGFTVTTPSIVIAPGSTDRVELRNLTVEPTTPCTSAGTGNGIDFQAGGPLHLENVTVTGFAGTGLLLDPSANSTVTIHGGSFSENCTAGIAASRPGGSIGVLVDDARVHDNGTGLSAGDGALIQLARTRVTGNTTAFATNGTGDFQAWPGNAFTPNGAAGWVPGTLPFS